ncbi:unnamed protein product, partial [Trichobilharzia szidati]
ANPYRFTGSQPPLAASTQQADFNTNYNSINNHNRNINNSNNNNNSNRFNSIFATLKTNKRQLGHFYESQEWQLKSLSRHCEKCEQNDSKEKKNPTGQMQKLTSSCSQDVVMAEQKSQSQQQQPEQQQQQQQQSQNEWETWTDQHEIKLTIRLAGFGHMCILRGRMILESYFLILSKKWMKAVIVGGDEVMILLKQPSQIKRFRLTFFNETDANSFFVGLSKFAATNLSNEVNEAQNAESISNNNNTDKETNTMTMTATTKNATTTATATPTVTSADPITIEAILNSMLTNQAQLPESWSTEWPTQSLDGLIRLCLIDPNFPGFVSQIDCVMKKFTTTIDDISNRDKEIPKWMRK